MAGVELGLDDKVSIAHVLDDLGVDIIEAGFPASSNLDSRATRIISREVYRARVAGLARATPRDVDAAAESEVDIIHVFIATSDVHLRHKLAITREEALKAAVEAVERARSYGVEVLFSAEDATRSDPRYLEEVYRSVVEAGVGYINIPDTVGVMTPWRMEALVKRIRESLPGWVRVDVHCHNDFGMATVNSIAGVIGGADGVQVTVNGFGERGGNAALEEVVASIHFQLGYQTGVRLERLTSASRIVAERFGIKLPPNKPVVGLNAFAHEAGIHVHGVLSNPATYEPIPPEAVGNRRRIVLGRHSGRAAVEYALRQLGVKPSRGLVRHILYRLKDVAPRMKKVDEDMIIAWVREYSVEARPGAGEG
ncbi:MAG: homoaconitate hydratase [Desulfurococcales archaeon]|nr:homoaconitate hydratase [Desulfurococcales archaeon]